MQRLRYGERRGRALLQAVRTGALRQSMTERKPQTPNSKSQRKAQPPNPKLQLGLGVWALGFALGFGVWVLGFAVPPAYAQIAMPDPALIHGKAIPAPELPNGTVTVRVVREAIGNNVVGQEVRISAGTETRSAKTDQQ